MTSLDRNTAIWHDHQNGKSMRQIASDYGISLARTQQIIARYQGHLAVSVEPYIIRKARRNAMLLTARLSSMQHELMAMEGELRELRQLVDLIVGSSASPTDDEEQPARL